MANVITKVEISCPECAGDGSVKDWRDGEYVNCPSCRGTQVIEIEPETCWNCHAPYEYGGFAGAGEPTCGCFTNIRCANCGLGAIDVHPSDIHGCCDGTATCPDCGAEHTDGTPDNVLCAPCSRLEDHRRKA